MTLSGETKRAEAPLLAKSLKRFKPIMQSFSFSTYFAKASILSHLFAHSYLATSGGYFNLKSTDAM